MAAWTFVHAIGVWRQAAMPEGQAGGAMLKTLVVLATLSGVVLVSAPAASPRSAATRTRTAIRREPTRCSARRTATGRRRQDNIFATTPGLEQQARRSTFTFNVLAPIFYNSNADLTPSGGTAGQNSAEFSPIVGLSWSTPVFDLPLRFTATCAPRSTVSPRCRRADFDKVALSGRLQYVDPTNDQAYSPYFVYAPRFDFDPFFRERFATRQDLNLGVNKTFNFDANFRRVPFSPDTLAETAWSFGVTVFGQRRFRDPQPSSWAFYVIPSMTYVISENWNVSLGIEVMRRWFDPYLGFNEAEWFIEPIATLEFVMPAAWFGSDRNASAVRPAGDRPADGLRAELVEHSGLQLQRLACRRGAEARLALLMDRICTMARP